jgi:hypothetical protein
LEPVLRPEIRPEKPPAPIHAHAKNRTPHRQHGSRKKAVAAPHPVRVARDVPPVDADVADVTDDASRPLLPGLEERLAGGRR